MHRQRGDVLVPRVVRGNTCSAARILSASGVLNRTGRVTSGILGRSAPAATSAVDIRTKRNHFIAPSSPDCEGMRATVRVIIFAAVAGWNRAGPLLDSLAGLGTRRDTMLLSSGLACCVLFSEWSSCRHPLSVEFAGSRPCWHSSLRWKSWPGSGRLRTNEASPEMPCRASVGSNALDDLPVVGSARPAVALQGRPRVSESEEGTTPSPRTTPSSQ